MGFFILLVDVSWSILSFRSILVLALGSLFLVPNEADGRWDVACADRTLEDALRRETIEHARSNIVARVGDVYLPRGGMDGNAIRFHEGGAIGDKMILYGLMRANIYYAVAYNIFAGFVTILRTDIVERVAEDTEVADGDVDSVEGDGSRT